MIKFTNNKLQDNSIAVRNMQEAYGQVNREEFIGTQVTEATAPLLRLRLNLIKEELDETIEAWNQRNLVEVVDGLCDILVVTLGTTHSLGIAPENPVIDSYASLFTTVPFMLGREGKPGTIAMVQEYFPHLVASLQNMEKAVNAVENSDKVAQVLADAYEANPEGLWSERGDKDILVGCISDAGAMEVLDFVSAFRRFSSLFYALFAGLSVLWPEIKLQENFEAVMGSNMQKFAETKEAADDTISAYSTQGISTRAEPFTLDANGVEKQLWRIVRNDDGKILKVKGWIPHEIDVSDETLQS